MDDICPWKRAAAQAAELAAELEAARELAARMRLSGEATGSRLATIELGGARPHSFIHSFVHSSARLKPGLNRGVHARKTYVQSLTTSVRLR